MAKRSTDNIITGNDTRLGMCFYYSPYFGQNIWRRASSLTSERTKKDPAFKGFRQSSSRLKQASPIAAALYKQVPQQLKQFALYRILTSEAIKMLREGIDEVAISETLKKKYIDSLLDAPRKNSKYGMMQEPGKRNRVKGMTDFTAYPHIPSGVRKMTRTGHYLLLQKIISGKSVAEYFSSTDSDSLPQAGRNVSESPFSKAEHPKEPNPRTKTTGGLIYLGRHPECKKLKIWVRPVDYSVLGAIIH